MPAHRCIMTTLRLRFSIFGRSVAVALFAVLAGTGCGGPQTDATALPASNDAALLRAGQPPAFTVYTAGQTPGFPITAAAEDITGGNGGTMWFTDPATPAIGRISATGTFSEFRTGLASGARPYVIVTAPDGSHWFSDYNGVTIGHITTGGKITEYGSPQQPSGDSAAGVAIAPDGTPWLITFGPEPMLVHVTAQKRVETIALPKDLSTDGTLAADANGNLWFVVLNKKTNALMVERTPGGSLIKMPMHMYQQFLPCCPHQAPKRLAIGADGNPWFSAMNYGRGTRGYQYFGTVAGGKVQLIRVSSKGLHHGAYASGIAVGPNGLALTGGDPLNPDGALWTVDAQRNQTVYDLAYDPIAVAFDRKGHPWLTAAWSGKPSQIVEVTLP